MKRCSLLLIASLSGAVAIEQSSNGAGLRGLAGVDPLKKVKDIIKRQIATSQDKLAEDSTQATMCKAQLEDVKGRLAKQTKVVEEAMKKLNDAKAADSEDLKDKLREAQHQQIDAETALDRAKRGISSKEAHDLELVQPKKAAQKVTAPPKVPVAYDPKISLRKALLHGQSLFHGVNHKAQDILYRSDPPTEEEKLRQKRETEKILDEAKYELKQEMKSLKNVNKEYEVLHDECTKNAGQEQTYEQRVAAREAEIDGLNKAYGVLGDMAPR